MAKEKIKEVRIRDSKDVDSPLKKSKKAPLRRKMKVVETCPSFRFQQNQADLDRLRSLTAPHVESFNYMLEKGLSEGVKALAPAELAILDGRKYQEEMRKASETGDAAPSMDDVSYVKFWFENARVSQPERKYDMKPLLPREARERKMMYSGTIRAMFCFEVVQRRNGVDFPGRAIRMPKEFGDLPIMVMSKACHLANTTAKELAAKNEEQNEMGGYFIVNGIERCVRMLQVPRRNLATAIQRSNYKNRGNIYSDLGVAMRCARYTGDQSTVTNTVHYLTTGGSTLKFVAKKQEFLIPVVLLIRALSGLASNPSDDSNDMNTETSGFGTGITDEEMYNRIVQGDEKNTFLVARAGSLLQDARSRYQNLNTPQECLAYVGARFRRLAQRAETSSDVEVGHFMVREYILVHLEKYGDKLECLLFMLRKLYAFAAGDCGVDNADSLQNQEILLPGHLISMFLKEKFEEVLSSIRQAITIDMRRSFSKASTNLQKVEYWSKMVDRFSQKSSGGIGKKVAHFLSTGNVISSTGLDLLQVSGYTIVAERLNFLRYCSHFRSVHRGQFFMEMKTTAVRKLLPDQWGFLCPVHTPDGGPCGLLSHLSLKGSVLAYEAKAEREDAPPLEDLLLSLGVTRAGAGAPGGRTVSSHSLLPVCIDGRIIGGASSVDCKRIAVCLRELKVETKPRVPATMEVAFIPPGNKGSPFPGLYLFTLSARMVRPVLQRATGKTEYIGPLEQGFMDIACLDEDIREGVTTHQELDPTNMLSLIANLTPFSDQNQSPRNMYQCQMGKQTMGTPAHSLHYRNDNKLYRLLTPQAPLVQTTIHSEYKMDEYPNGTNAVIAVMSYTGFDMEDAMILNKGSYDRGFAHATIYKTVDINLDDVAQKEGYREAVFTNKNRHGEIEKLEPDGFPSAGMKVTEGDPLYAVGDAAGGGDPYVAKHKDKEDAFVQNVRMLGGDTPSDKLKASLTLRLPRNPVIGDKFSSRHGQKGVLSILWPQSDMPFTESGITPDILFNPHGFPSRMTIGMLVEMMAAKSGSCHGFYQNGTPFAFHESGDQVSIDYFGEQLQAAGYNYYGSEPLYSGVSGCIMHADLYIGVVYYQRLRHMVSDKYQVRATGPTNQLTRQPIKGRKKGGGIRLGEMERDSLLSHGAAFLMHDRLLNCSDRHIAYACCRCGDLLNPSTERSTLQTAGQSAAEAMNKPRLRLLCRNPACREASQTETGNDDAVEPLIMPYVYRYLVNELAAMNVGMKLDIR
uniref:DNA-directed RNA polymerase subunit beta n=1 Tax=Entomoneis paludosa TaxID=265537 RepID=A0A7S2V994_9STRA|mmetsp:Transcript_10430/g.21438  ORF Transcript_10430/g.21438 Transcript_10430/m.21438 type:complete len:1248 (+) Transcript_10430:76-3819(+)